MLNNAVTYKSATQVKLNFLPVRGTQIYNCIANDKNYMMSYYKKIRWLNLIAVLITISPFLLKAQSNIVRVEYYLDSAVAYGSGITSGVTFTPGPDVNVSLNVNLAGKAPGLHVLGVRSRDANGVWSMDQTWLMLIAGQAVTTPNIVSAEYYVDGDLGYGKCKPISVTAGQDRSLSFSPSLDSLGGGLHVIGVRTKDAHGAWSEDEKWLIVKQPAAVPLVNIVKAEYFIDNDSGYGKGINITINAGQDIQELSFSPDISTLNEGLHIVGVRTKDANGLWSFDNLWVFAKSSPFKPTPALKYVEYYIDSLPDYGAGTPVAISPVSNLPDYSIPVNISGLSVGKHGVYFRSRDANGAWSLDDSIQFNITSTASLPYIVVNSISRKTVCAGNQVDVSFDAKGTFNANNIFTVQMSNINGSFASPINIGADTGRKNKIIACTIPSNTTPGKGYRLRVVSSNIAATGITGADTLTIGAVLAAPTITANGPTTFCAGSNVKLTSSSSAAYVWNSGDTTKTITATTSGNYRVTITNTSGCTAISLPTIVTVNPIPNATISASGSTTNVCPGIIVTLTASGGGTYLWSNGATTSGILVSGPDSYSVIVTSPSGCKDTSAPTVVTYASCPAPKGLKATVTSATTATLKWKQAICGVGYQVQLRLAGSTTWSAPVSVAALSYKPAGLFGDTSYEWQVATICQANPLIISAYSPGAVFTTPVSFDAAIALINPKTTGIFNASIMPNPTNGSTALTVNGAPSGYSVSIGDIAGKVLWKSLNVKDRRFQLPVERFAPGVYLVIISNGVNTKVLKLVKR